ncbi:MAG: glycosyltransferase family 2 protein [Candidatus Binatia bacterium]
MSVQRSARSSADPAAVTLLIPHFQTLAAIRLCLRAVRRFSEPLPRVLLLDNGSTDAALDYLHGLKWIECVHTGIANDLASAQAGALNLGAARVETPYFAIMHSDTYVHRAGWLAALIAVLERGGYAAVGSRHQTVRARDSRLFATVAAWTAPLLPYVSPRATSAGAAWLRSCLTLYRTRAFRAAGCRFASDGEEDATHAAHAALAARGERLLALPDRFLGYYIFHKGDTTRIANGLYSAEDADFRARIARHREHLRRFHSRRIVQDLLSDPTLDH